MSLENLPVEWKTTDIGQLVDDMFGGLSPKTTDYQVSGVLALNKGDIKQSGTLKIKNSANYLSDNFIGSNTDKIVQKNDVLVTLRDLSQKADFLGLVALYKGSQKAVITQGMYKLLLNNALDRRYLMWYSNSPLYRLQVKNEKVGATQVHLRNDQFKDLNIPLPPIAEQQEIVRQLDVMLAQVEQIKTRLDAIPAILKKFRQSVLADAVSGKLTEEWRTSCKEIENSWQPDFQTSVVSDERYIFELPTNWVWDHLGNLTENFNHLRVPVKQGDRREKSGEYPYYGAFGVIDHIDEFKFDGTYLLLAEDGKNLESRSRPIALIAKGKFWVNNHAHVMTAKENISLEYLEMFLNSPVVAIDQFLTGMDQVKLNKNAMVKLPISIPPYIEQLKIVELVNTYFRYSDRIEITVQSAQKRVNLLTQSILAKAFSGELTAEWREQHQELITGINSAESLLAKIQAEREASKPVKKAKKVK